MRPTWTRAIAGAGLLTVLVAGPAASATDDDLTAARALFERNLQAIRDRDTEAYLACYRDDPRLVVTGFGGPRAGYEEWAAGVGGEWPASFEAFDLEVFAITDGVVYGTYRYRVGYDDRVREGLSERIFLETDDGWRIAVSTAFDAPDGALPPLPGDHE